MRPSEGDAVTPGRCRASGTRNLLVYHPGLHHPSGIPSSWAGAFLRGGVVPPALANGGSEQTPGNGDIQELSSGQAARGVLCLGRSAAFFLGFSSWRRVGGGMPTCSRAAAFTAVTARNGLGFFLRGIRRKHTTGIALWKSLETKASRLTREDSIGKGLNGTAKVAARTVPSLRDSAVSLHLPGLPSRAILCRRCAAAFSPACAVVLAEASKPFLKRRNWPAVNSGLLPRSSGGEHAGRL